MNVSDDLMLWPKLTANLVIKAEVDGAVGFQLLTVIVTKIPKLKFNFTEEAKPNVTEVLNATWVKSSNQT